MGTFVGKTVQTAMRALSPLSGSDVEIDASLSWGRTLLWPVMLLGTSLMGLRYIVSISD